MSGFKGEGIGGGGSGSAYQQIGFQDLNEADLVYEKKKEEFKGEGIGGGGSGSAYQPALGFKDLGEGFRGGGGEAIGGRTAGPNNIGDLGASASVGGGATQPPGNWLMNFLSQLFRSIRGEGFRGGEAIHGDTAGPNNTPNLGESAEFFSEQEEKKKEQIAEAFQNIGAPQEVTGTPETSDVSGPADASLKQPREPYNLLKNLPPAPRGSISCLTAACCSETDFEQRTNQTGNFLQRTNNYKREFPDSCSAPLTELNLAFYKNSFLPKT